MSKVSEEKNGLMDAMFAAGAHFAYPKARRHPSAKPYIFGTKNKVEIFDLEKTKAELERAKEFVRQLGREGRQIIFVGGKNEARGAVLSGAQSIGMPYVAGRWIGGTLTNFSEIRKRVDKMEDLVSKKEKGELAKYTKRERLMIDREIDKLRELFFGISSMGEKPRAMFVIDSKREHIAVEEAKKSGVPVIALSGSDCDLKEVDYPMPGNDASSDSISFFVNELTQAYKEGRASAK